MRPGTTTMIFRLFFFMSIFWTIECMKSCSSASDINFRISHMGNRTTSLWIWYLSPAISMFVKVCGVQLQVLESTPVGLQSHCILRCSPKADCAGYVYNKGSCVLYSKMTDSNSEPRTIYLKTSSVIPSQGVCYPNYCLNGGKCNNQCECDCRPEFTGDRCQLRVFEDCSKTFDAGITKSGIYHMLPEESAPFRSFCDSGWTVLMKRTDGSMDFHQDWQNYKEGFGDLSGDHWLGNDKIHALSNQKNYALRVIYTYWSTGVTYHANYDTFRIENEASNFRLTVTGFSGNGTDSGFSGQHNGKMFTTFDRDNDLFGSNCAVSFSGGFWFHSCISVTPTGQYTEAGNCISWGGACCKAMTWLIKPVE